MAMAGRELEVVEYDVEGVVGEVMDKVVGEDGYKQNKRQNAEQCIVDHEQQLQVPHIYTTLTHLKIGAVFVSRCDSYVFIFRVCPYVKCDIFGWSLYNHFGGANAAFYAVLMPGLCCFILKFGNYKTL